MVNGSAPDGTSYINTLNHLAVRMAWPVIGDPGCHFRENKLYAVLDLWLDVAVDGPPHRREMTARMLQPYLPFLTIIEREPGLGAEPYRYRVRLMGANTERFNTEMTGRYLDEVVPERYLSRWYGMVDAVIGAGRPVRLLTQNESFKKNYVVGESFAAPLLSDSGVANLVMAVSYYEGRSWERVAATERQQLGLECPATNVHLSSFS